MGSGADGSTPADATKAACAKPECKDKCACPADAAKCAKHECKEKCVCAPECAKPECKDKCACPSKSAEKSDEKCGMAECKDKCQCKPAPQGWFWYILGHIWTFIMCMVGGFFAILALLSVIVAVQRINKMQPIHRTASTYYPTEHLIPQGRRQRYGKPEVSFRMQMGALL